MKTHLINNSKLFITLAIIFIASMGFSQTKGSGNVITDDRNVGDFTSIKLTCSADLYISQGSKSVTVKADDNIIEMVETTVENGTLVIGVKGRGFRSISVLEVYITTPDLDKLKNSGSGDIVFSDTFAASDLFIGINGSGDLHAKFDVRNLELQVSGSGDTELTGVRGVFKVSNSGSGDLDAEGLKLEECYIKNSGSGDLELVGKTNNLTATINGSGDFDGYNLTAVNATISNSGSSDVVIDVVEELHVVLNGSGDLTYRGNPEKVDVSSNGPGDVYKK
jgi:hypothetical protein